LEVDVQQGNFKILRLLPHVLILFLIKNGFFQVSQLVKNTEGILGVNPPISAHALLYGSFKEL
jgi:hypothetical protein